MSTFRTALHGTSWAVAAQAVIAVGQIAYSALTARIFSPHAFGEFTAALTLHGLVVLCTATGLSSFVLKEAYVSRSQLRAVNVIVVSLALLGAAVFWFVSPLWLVWLNSPGGSMYVPLLTWATFATPIGSVQSALLRREGNGLVDAAAYVISFAIATVLAAICAVLLRQPWALALGVAVNPSLLIVFSRLARRAVYPGGRDRLSFAGLTFALRVTGQNLIFMGLAQVPTWAMGASATPATLGQFSRGNTLAGLAANALTTAMNRGTSPHWRKIETRESRIRAVNEALLLGANLSFICFATIAALSRPLTALWLGPGWGLAAEFTAWLASGSAVLVPLALLANYLEMTGALSRVRWIQAANAAVLAIGVALFVWLHDFRWLLGGLVLSQLAGLIIAVFQVSAELGTDSRQFLRQLTASLVSALGAAGAAFGAASVVALGMPASTAFWEAAQLCAGGSAVVAYILLTRKCQPAFSVLVARGVLNG